jgi:predicted kinase
MVKWHQAPFFAGLREDALGLQKLSLSLNLSELAIVARADAMGRKTIPIESWQATLDNIDMFEALACQLDVWDKPRHCIGTTERGVWLEKSGGYDPSYPWPSPIARPLLVATCGMPASGKSTFALDLGLPITGLDWARSELGAEHGDDEGGARNLALGELKKHLARGSSVVFDATNLIPDHRQRLAQLAAAYGADCIFAHHEAATQKDLYSRNALRGAKAVPRGAMDRMLEKWSAPVGDEGGGQVYFKNGSVEPVWGAMDSPSWSKVLEKARAVAQKPGGKPLGSKRAH